MCNDWASWGWKKIEDWFNTVGSRIQRRKEDQGILNKSIVTSFLKRNNFLYKSIFTVLLGIHIMRKTWVYMFVIILSSWWMTLLPFTIALKIIHLGKNFNKQAKDFYTEKYKTLMKERRYNQMERHPVLIDWKTIFKCPYYWNWSANLV